MYLCLIKYILFNILELHDGICNRTETDYKTREARVNYKQESKPKKNFICLNNLTKTQI